MPKKNFAAQLVKYSHPWLCQDAGNIKHQTRAAAGVIEDLQFPHSNTRTRHRPLLQNALLGI